MRRVALLTCAALASCHQPTAVPPDDNGASNVTEASPPPAATGDVAAMLKAGAPQVCTDDGVQQTIIASVKTMEDLRAGIMLGIIGSEDADAATRQVSLSLSEVTFSGADQSLGSSGADQSLGSVTCDANLVIHGGDDGGGDFTSAVRYDVRPALDKPGSYVVKSNADRLTDDYAKIVMHVARTHLTARMDAEQKARAAAPPPPAPADAAQPNPNGDPSPLSASNQL